MTRYPAAAALAFGLVLATAGPVLADTSAPSAAPSASPSASSGSARGCTSQRLDRVQSRVDSAVSKRLTTIQRLTSALASRPHVTDAHRAALTELYAGDSSGLKAVDAKVQADTTCQAAVTDGRTVVTSFRVYLLLAPQTRLVSASDTGTYAAGRLAAAVPKAQTAVDALTDPTKKAAAQAKLDDLKAKVAAAQADFSGVGDEVLALVPADIPAKTGTLDGYRGKVADGRTALRAAAADAKALRDLLR